MGENNLISKDLEEIRERVSDLNHHAIESINKEMEADRPNMKVSSMWIEVQSASTKLALSLKNLTAYYNSYYTESSKRITPRPSTKTIGIPK